MLKALIFGAWGQEKAVINEHVSLTIFRTIMYFEKAPKMYFVNFALALKPVKAHFLVSGRNHETTVP